MPLPRTRRRDFHKLTKDFLVHCRNDIAKRCILFSNIILQSLNVWPDHDNWFQKWLMILVIINESIMGAAHFAYALINFANVSKMTSAFTTVLVTLETVAKLTTLMYYRRDLNTILKSIWVDFWPSKLASLKRQKEINSYSNYVLLMGASFLFMAFFSNAQFMMFPLIQNLDQLPLASWYPFDFKSSPTYELMYIWQWFMNQVVITTLTGFDSFFNALVMICASQFNIMQDVLENIVSARRRKQWKIILGDDYKDDLNEMDLLVCCIKHHLKLLKICKSLEQIFSHIIFLQFVISTLAMCVPCVALFADPDVWEHMLSYLIAHVFQFFVYCSVGNELTLQSVMIADAAYNSEWESSNYLNFRKGLIMVIQRSHKPVCLTVAGLMQLNFANFLATVHLSFSFYTLLNTFV